MYLQTFQNANLTCNTHTCWYWNYFHSTLFTICFHMAYQTCVHIVYIFNFNELIAQQWRHDKRDGDSNHQRIYCLLKHLFSRRSKKTLKPCVTGLCVRGSRWWPVNSLHKRASDAENVSIWWSHHGHYHWRPGRSYRAVGFVVAGGTTGVVSVGLGGAVAAFCSQGSYFVYSISSWLYFFNLVILYLHSETSSHSYCYLLNVSVFCFIKPYPAISHNTNMSGVLSSGGQRIKACCQLILGTSSTSFIVAIVGKHSLSLDKNKHQLWTWWNHI